MHDGVIHIPFFLLVFSMAHVVDLHSPLATFTDSLVS